MCDLEREIGPTLRGSVLGVHAFTILVTMAGRGREQTGLAREKGSFERLSLDSLSKRLKSQLSLVATALWAVSGATRT